MYPKPDKPTEGVKPEVPSTPITPAVCNTMNGTLPSCAPLSVPYVPFQQKGSPKYEVAEALDNGTLFPGLNLPFFRKAEAAQVPATPLAELQALEFVLTELGLYLDTHQDDAEAMELFRQYAALEKAGRERYEAQYGPITQAATAQSKTWAWIKDPWPWNDQEGGKA